MTFYDSFSRLGKSLDQVTTIGGIAWPWRHYNGLQYQSYSERVAASEPFPPMAWVWCHYRGSLPSTQSLELAPPLIEERLIEAPNISDNEEVPQIQEYVQEVNYPKVEQSHQFPTSQAEDEDDDDDTITFIEIVKLMAALFFAASIIYGVHVLGG